MFIGASHQFGMAAQQGQIGAHARTTTGGQVDPHDRRQKIERLIVNLWLRHVRIIP